MVTTRKGSYCSKGKIIGNSPDHDWVMTSKRLTHYWPFAKRSRHLSVDSCRRGPIIWTVEVCYCYPKFTVEQTVKLPLIWDNVTLIRHHGIACWRSQANSILLLIAWCNSQWNNTDNMVWYITVKPVYNDHLIGYLSAFRTSSRWPLAT